MSYLFELPKFIISTFSSFPSRYLIDDDRIACNIFDDSLGLFPIFFKSMQLIIWFPLLKSLQHFCILYLNWLKLFLSYWVIKTTCTFPLWPSFSFSHNVGNFIKKQTILSFNLSTFILILHLFLFRIKSNIHLFGFRNSSARSNSSHIRKMSLS